MIKLKSLLNEGGAVKFTNKFDNKILNILDIYLNDAYELLYVYDFIKYKVDRVLDLAKKEYPEEDYLDSATKFVPIYLKKGLDNFKNKYPDLKHYNFESDYSINYSKKGSIVFNSGATRAINRSFELNVDLHKDFPKNYINFLGKFNNLNVTIKFEMDYTNKKTQGMYLDGIIYVYVNKVFIYNYDVMKKNLLDTIQHEYVHHLQKISNNKFGIDKSGHDYKDTTNLSHYKYFYDTTEIKPLIATHASQYEMLYDTFNNRQFEEFVNNIMKYKTKTKLNKAGLANFKKELYNELQRRFDMKGNV